MLGDKKGYDLNVRTKEMESYTAFEGARRCFWQVAEMYLETET